MQQTYVILGAQLCKSSWNLNFYLSQVTDLSYVNFVSTKICKIKSKTMTVEIYISHNI